MSENAENVCEICSQEISEDNRASFANGHTSTTDVERVICNECFGNLHGESSEVKFEEVPISLIEFNTDIPKIVEVPFENIAFYCYQCGYCAIDETTFSEHQDNHNAVSVTDKVLEATKVPELVQRKKYKCKIIKTMHSKRFKRHQGNPVKKTSFKCDLFKSFAVLSARLKKDVPNFNCHFCAYSTTDGTSFQRHIRTHTTSYKCKFCDYCSATRFQLRQHMYKHTGDNPYKCKVCDYSTAYSCNLKAHMYSVHPRFTH